jgi:hypothetical protein
MSLTLTSQPGFTEIPVSTFADGNPASDSAFKSLNAATKFAAVRNEQFYGYYANGQTVVLPVSPADGYQYSREELMYAWSLYSSSSPTDFEPGQETPPVTGPPSGSGTLLGIGPWWVDQATGVVHLTTSYFKSSQSVTTDGILCVITHAQRQR